MSLVDFIFPKKCLECGSSGLYVCKTCLDKVSVSKAVCIECEKPSIDGMTHAKCRKKRSLDRAISIWKYEGVIRRAVLKLKYNFAFDIANELAGLSTTYLRQSFDVLPQKAIMLPIPLHRQRENWRGFNQAVELGRLIASEMAWKFDTDLLLRKKTSEPQVKLSEMARTASVKGIFSLNTGRQVSGSDYIIFDDVWTTGSTLKEAVKVLKRAKAGTVLGLTIAR